jgi:hypothetical protein
MIISKTQRLFLGIDNGQPYTGDKKTTNQHYVRVYGLLYYWFTLFTWYGHKNLVNTVLTAAVSDLHYSTLWLQWQCLI